MFWKKSTACLLLFCSSLFGAEEAENLLAPIRRPRPSPSRIAALHQHKARAQKTLAQTKNLRLSIQNLLSTRENILKKATNLENENIQRISQRNLVFEKLKAPSAKAQIVKAKAPHQLFIKKLKSQKRVHVKIVHNRAHYVDLLKKRSLSKIERAEKALQTFKKRQELNIKTLKDQQKTKVDSAQKHIYSVSKRYTQEEQALRGQQKKEMSLAKRGLQNVKQRKTNQLRRLKVEEKNILRKRNATKQRQIRQTFTQRRSEESLNFDQKIQEENRLFLDLKRKDPQKARTVQKTLKLLKTQKKQALNKLRKEEKKVIKTALTLEKKLVTLEYKIKQTQSAETFDQQIQKQELFISHLQKEQKKDLASLRAEKNRTIATEKQALKKIQTSNYQELELAKKSSKEKIRKKEQKFNDLKKKEQNKLKLLEKDYEKDKLRQHLVVLTQKKQALKQTQEHAVEKKQAFFKEGKQKMAEEKKLALAQAIDHSIRMILKKDQVESIEGDFTYQYIEDLLWSYFSRGLEIRKEMMLLDEINDKNHELLQNKVFDFISSGTQINDRGSYYLAEILLPQDQASIFSTSMLELYIPPAANKLANYHIQSKDSIFIDKNAFFSNLQSSEKDLQFESLNSFIAGLPGLEEYEHIGWGIWSTQILKPQRSESFGFFSYGDLQNLSSQNDLNELAKQGREAVKNGLSPVINYNGRAIGSIFNAGSLPQVELGTASFRVNFANGQVNGDLAFKKGLIQLDGKISRASFSGLATIDGSGNGAFRGNFYGKDAKEAAGSFAVQKAKQHAIGAFAVKK